VARRWLFVLVTVVALLAWALGRPRNFNAVPLAPASTPALGADRTASVAAVLLPSELARAHLEPAVRDPFLPVAPPAPVVKVVPPPPVVQVPPAPPAPPPLNLRFAGRMTTPNGATMVLAAYGDATLTLSTGLVLPNGYRVDAIERDVVRLTYPPLNAPATLDLAPPPRYEIR
jgi:hypothetical protein